jgi:hypothetical protein
MRRYQHRVLLALVAWLLVSCAMTGNVVAGSMFSDIQENIAVMMESQAANQTFIARSFGIDAASVLSFSSSTDVVGKAFSYSLAPGSTYNGLSMTFDVAGAFNAPLGLWELTSSGSLGTESWTGIGTASVLGDPRVEVEWNWTSRVLGFDYASVTVYVDIVPFLETVSAGVLVNTTHGMPVGFGVSVDALVRIPGTPFVWEWEKFLITSIQPGVDPADTGQGFRVVSSGTILETGGVGRFTAQIQPIPEPSTWLLMGSSLLGLLGYGWHRHK